MIVKKKKKDIEIGIYQKEIYDNLQKVYKEKFPKYVNENNYEIYEYKENPFGNKKLNKSEYFKEKKKIEIDNINININEAFKNFIGKKFYIDDNYEKIYKENKSLDIKDIIEKKKYETKLKYIDILKEYYINIISSIISIKKRIIKLKNYMEINNYFKKNEKSIIDIFIKINKIENNLLNIIKYGELNDKHFKNNFKHYKNINNFVNNKKNNIFNILQNLKINSLNDKNNLNVNKIIHFNNFIRFQKNNIYEKYNTINYKVENLNNVLDTICLLKNENFANILLSFCLFLNICINEKIYNRIINYINLYKLKIKRHNEYMKNENIFKLLHIISNFKSKISKFNDSKNLSNVFTIDLNENDKQMLNIYRKLLHNEINIKIISHETEQISETIKQMNKNINIQNIKLKSLFMKKLNNKNNYL